MTALVPPQQTIVDAVMAGDDAAVEPQGGV